jgi:hypothetical protein
MSKKADSQNTMEMQLAALSAPAPPSVVPPFVESHPPRLVGAI